MTSAWRPETGNSAAAESTSEGTAKLKPMIEVRTLDFATLFLPRLAYRPTLVVGVMTRQARVGGSLQRRHAVCS